MKLQFEFGVIDTSSEKTTIILTNNIQNLFFIFERENLAGKLYSDIQIRREEKSKFIHIEGKKIIWAKLDNPMIPVDEQDEKSLLYQLHNIELEVVNEIQIVEGELPTKKFKKADKIISKFIQQTQVDSKNQKDSVTWVMTNKEFSDELFIQNDFILEILEDNLLEIYASLDNKFEYI